MNKQTSLSIYISNPAVQKSIQSVLGARSPQFVTSMIAAVNANENLQKCERKSILSACLTAASLDLPINQNLGFAYLIPYKVKVVTHDKNGKEITTWEDHAQFQAGYKAFIQLAQRSGQMKTVNTSDVRKGEFEGVDRLTGDYRFTWIEEGREKLPIIGYVAYFELLNGFRKSLYMTSEELKAHGVKYSKTAKKGYGLWVDEFDAMAKKTILKLLLAKYAPLTTEMAKAIEADQAIVKDEGYEYPDNQPVDPKEVAAEKEKARVIDFINKAKAKKDLQKVESYLPDEETKNLYDSKLATLKA